MISLFTPPAACPDPAEFRDPGARYRPMIMWIWNDDIDRATLRAQIADFREKGLGGFFLHPMPDSFRKHDFIAGIKQPYPGEAFLGWVKAAAQIAREHGLYCWLYDEGGWPSGTLVGTLAKDRPELAGRVLRAQVLPCDDAPAAPPGEEAALLPLPDGRRLRFYASREGYPTDLMNPATTDAFLASTHEKYAECLGSEFGGLVPGIFTDEACVGGCIGTAKIPWTPALPEIFRERKGYDLLPYLPALFGDEALPEDARGALTPEQAARARYDFGDVWTQLHADAFYGRTREWCRKHRLPFVGHVGGEDDLMGHGSHGFGHFFRVMRYLDVPGVDAIWRQIFPGQPHAHFSKLAASAAHGAGKPLALSESFAVYAYGLTYAQMKWVTDRQYGDGINLMAPMAAHYTSAGGRAYCTLANLAWGNPQWPLFKEYCDYAGRLSYLLRLGRPAAQVAVFYPASSLWVARDPAIAESFHAVADLLQEAQIDFDYVDEEALAEAHIEGSVLRVGEQAYQAVVLPRTLALPWRVLEELASLHEQGGTVIAVDGLPWLCPEAEHQEQFAALLAEVFGGNGERAPLLPPEERATLPAVLRAGMTPDFALAEPNREIRYCRRVLDAGPLYFVVNAGEQAQELTVTAAGIGIPEVWDPDRGTAFRLPGETLEGRTRVRLSLQPLGAVFLFLRAGESPLPTLPAVRPQREKHIEGPWEAAPVHACRLVQGEPREEITPAGCEGWQPVELTPWAAWGLPHFSGSIAYRCAFDLTAAEARGAATLDLGTVKYNAVVTVNGEPAGTRVWPPYTVNVTGKLHPGRNEIRVTVTNTWANQFLRPEEIAYARERGWYNIYAQRVEAFQRESLESGLLGPVVLRGEG